MEQLAWAVLRGLGEDRAPVDIFAVCRAYGELWGYFQAAKELKTSVAALSGDYRLLDGFTLGRGEQRPLVLYNDVLPLVRVRFTVAHETAHLILRHKPAGEDGFGADSRQEREADTLAAALLMPLPLLRQHRKRGLALTEEAVAEAFAVSQKAASIRLRETAL